MNILEMKKFASDEMSASLKNILGIHFAKMKVFFETNLFDFDKNICTVLVTRRCFLMAIWFLGFFAKQEDFARNFEFTTIQSCMCIRHRETGRINYIISDKGIPLLRILKDIEEIRILDDICIHGRQLESMKLSVCEYSGLSSDKVRKIVFMISEESLIKKETEAMVSSTNGQWVMPSQRIVDAINYLQMPYVSYLNSFIKFGVSLEENEAFLEALGNDDQLVIKEFGKDSRLQSGKQSFYIVEKQDCEKNDDVETDLACIRYYYNFKTHVASFIPYVVLKPLSERFDAEKIRTALGAYLKEEAVGQILKEIVGLLEEDYKDNQGYIYNLLSCIASCHHGIRFAEKHLSEKFNFINEKNKWVADIISSVVMAFGERIATLILNFDNYISLVTEEGCVSPQKIYLGIMKNDIADFEVTRWAERELAAENIEIEPPKRRLYSLAEEVVKKYSRHETFKTTGIIKHSFLCAVINDCDNGRLNIASTLQAGDSFLEVGELGVLTVRETNSLTPTIETLLLNPYYYYILC